MENLVKVHGNGIVAISFNGEEYHADENGVFVVPVEAIPVLAAEHGFTQLPMVEAASEPVPPPAPPEGEAGEGSEPPAQDGETAPITEEGAPAEAAEGETGAAEAETEKTEEEPAEKPVESGKKGKK